MIVRTGIDLIEIQRFINLNPSILKRFITRVLTDVEQTEVKNSMPKLAGKFAAKEAAVKALGCGIGPISWQEVEILHNPEGQPKLYLHDKARQIAIDLNLTEWSLSISHTQKYTTAIVVMVGI
jgi:holo-[acyl-carrier protein] synthase